MRRLATLAAASSLLIAGLVFIPTVPAAAIEGGTLGAANSPMWQTNNWVWSLAVANGVLYAGGDFTSVRPPGSAKGTNESPRNHVAAFSTSTGVALAWNPNVDGRVDATAISPSGTTLYIGGTFTHVNGLVRNRAAAFDLTTGNLTSWGPNVNGPVLAIAVAPGGTVYMGGAFTKVNGLARAHLAAANPSGALLSWAPTTDGYVAALAVPSDSSRVIVGGGYNTLDGVSQRAIGAVDPSTGAMMPWAFDPMPPTSDVKTIITDGAGHAFIGAEGTGGGVFDGTFAVNYADGSEVWYDNCLGATQSLVLLNGWLYDGSHMHDCTGSVPGGPPPLPQTWYHLTVESPLDGHVGHWFPYTSGNPLGPKAMISDGSQLFVGGDFVNVNHVAQQGLTRFAPGPDATRPVKPAAPGVSSTFCAGTANVSYRATTDIDDGALTYNLFRDNTTLIDSRVVSSEPWSQPTVSVVNSGLVPGSTHTYSIQVSDGTTAPWVVKSASVKVASTTNPYPCGVVGDGPWLYWRLGESSGTTAADSSGNGFTGIYGSGITLAQPGAILTDPTNTAASFSGAGSVGSTSAFADPQNYSIQAWFKTTTTTGGKIVGFGDAQSGNSGQYDRHIYMTDSGQLIFGVWEGFPATVSSPASYNDGNWHQVVATMDPSTGMSLYVDGTLVDSNSSFTSSQSYSGYWRVGGDNLNGWTSQPTSSNFSGSIDDVSIYPSTLSPAQVSTDHSNAGYPTISGFTPPTGPAGTTVTINGSRFTGATDVKFNGTSVGSFTVNTDNKITATVPVGATSGPIQVISPNGAGLSADAFIVIPPPSISGFSPAFGPSGTSVTIFGNHFTGANDVTFNGTSVTGSFTVLTDQKITATVPAGATSGPIQVISPDGAGTSFASFTVGACSDTYLCGVVANGPSLYWRLGEPSGSTAGDSSGNGFTGTYGSGITLAQPGAILSDSDTAASFSGAGSVGSNDSFSDPQNFSVEVWFKTTTTTGGKIVGFGNVQAGDSSNYDRHIYMTDSGQLIFGVWEGFPATVSSPASYNDGNWHQVVATMDPSTGMSLYVDGTLVDSNSSFTSSQSYSGYWRVGGDNLNGWTSQPTSSNFSGSIDEVSIYPSTLSPSQVSTDYANAGY